MSGSCGFWLVTQRADSAPWDACNFSVSQSQTLYCCITFAAAAAPILQLGKQQPKYAAPPPFHIAKLLLPAQTHRLWEMLLAAHPGRLSSNGAVVIIGADPVGLLCARRFLLEEAAQVLVLERTVAIGGQWIKRVATTFQGGRRLIRVGCLLVFLPLTHGCMHPFSAPPPPTHFFSLLVGNCCLLSAGSVQWLERMRICRRRSA